MLETLDIEFLIDDIDFLVVPPYLVISTDVIVKM